MPYTIDWKFKGAVKRFSGVVAYKDVLKSEQEISGSMQFTDLRYVISDYSDAEYKGLCESEEVDVTALRLGGYITNKGIKYAFVGISQEVQRHLCEAVVTGRMPYQTRVFDNYEQVAKWLEL